jgi:O-antigen/teichoic acid export membrane protein
MKRLQVIISRLEKKLWIDVRYFLKGGSLLVLSQIVFSLRSLGIILIVTNFLWKEAYWQYNFILSLVWIASLFALPGTYNAIIQSVSRGFLWTYTFLLKKIFYFSSLGGILLIGCGFWLHFFRDYPHYEIFLFLWVLFPFYSISGIYAYFLTGIQDFSRRVQYEILTHIFVVIGAFFSIWYFESLPIFIILIFLIQTGVGMYFHKKIHLSPKQEIDYESYYFGMKLTALGILSTCKMHIDKLIVSYFFGFAQLAVYALALAMNEQIYSLGKIIATIIMPKTSNLNQEQIRLQLPKLIGIIFFLFGTFSLFLILVYPYLIPLLFWESFSGAVFYAQILTAFVSIKIVFFILSYIDLSQKDMYSTVFSSTISPLIEIICMILWGLYFWVIWVVAAKIFWDALNLLYFFTQYSKRERK